MRTLFRRHRTDAAALVLLAGLASGCSYNKFTTQEEAIKAQWGQWTTNCSAEPDSQPRRERQGIRAAGKMSSAPLPKRALCMAGATTPAEKIEAANAQSTALSRLLVVVENYPQLKSNETFARLMDELAGTENRLSTERMRYNEKVQGEHATPEVSRT